MSATKDMWMDEVERVGEEFSAGKIERDAAVARLRRAGFDPEEIDDMLAAAVA